MGHVIVDQETGEADLFERPHRFNRVDVPFANEALLELGHRAFDVAEVNVEDLAPRAEEFDRLDHTLAHLRPTAHAKVQSVVIAWRNVQDPVTKALEAAKQPRYPAE